MEFLIYGLTDKGAVRPHNEDSILINREVISCEDYCAMVKPPFLTAVCDGVGGEKAGEIASNYCLLQLSFVDYSSNLDIDDILIKIHNKIKRKGVNINGAENMQTTLCCLAIDENGNAMCINVGDSRMYRFTNNDIRQITTDHSLAQYLFDNGEIDDFSQITPQMRSTIISSMGSCQQPPKIDHIPFATKLGRDCETDMVLICSDGISDYVSIDEIQIALSMQIPFEGKISTIYKLAIKNGSTDNISIIGIIPKKHYDDDIERLRRISKEREEIKRAVAAVAAEKSEMEKYADENLTMLQQFIDSLDKS